MKVLIVSSSPRKGGNSEVLCKEFEAGANSKGHSVETVYVGDKKINYCTGCGYCFSHQGVCSQKDDMVEIKDKMINADIIVLSTPIYFYTMCGQLKTFIDRCCFFYRSLAGKGFYYIMTSADTSKSAMDRTISEFGGFLACIPSSKLLGTVYGVGAWDKGDISKTAHVKEAFAMGENIGK